MRFPSRLFVLLSCVVLCAAVAMAEAPGTLFQINGNAANDNLTCSYGTPCDYWNLLNGTGNTSPVGGVGNGSSPGHSSVRTFLNGASITDTRFGQGTEDFLQISGNRNSWTYQAASTSPKTTINAAYVAAYTAPSNDFVLMFGGDRASQNGSTYIGFWLLQDGTVAPIGTTGGGFTGTHIDHDILILVNYTNGGSVFTPNVYEWNTAVCGNAKKNASAGVGQCAEVNLRVLVLPTGGAVSCFDASFPYCATANGVTTNTTWEGNIGPPQFFQGGVDVTQALSNVGVTTLPCFSQFIIETRSSPTVEAELKDFLLGQFPVCSVSITKLCDVPNTHVIDPPGNLVQYAFTGVVRNTGIGPLYNVTLTDTFPASSTVTNITSSDGGGGTFTSSTGTFVFNNPIPANGTFNYSGTYRNPVASGLHNNIGVAAAASPGGLKTVTGSFDLLQCPPTILPGLKITKSCLVSLQQVSGVGVVIQVDNTYSVCNTGDSQITGITVTDNQTLIGGGTTVGTISTLNAPASPGLPGNCTSLNASYRPPACTTDPSGGTCAFTDIGTITTGTSAFGGGSVQGGQIDAGHTADLSGSATCHLCPAGACSAGTP